MSKQSDEQRLDWKFWAAFGPFALLLVVTAIFTVAETAIKFGW